MPIGERYPATRAAGCRRQVIDAGLAAGSSASVERTFTAAEVEAFGRITGDLNPYHFEPEFAASSRFGGPIVHGLLVASMLTEIGGQWAWLATAMTFRFVAPVRVGDTVTLEVTVVSMDERGFASAEAYWTNHDGKVVLTGTLEGYPPKSEQRRLLGEIG